MATDEEDFPLINDPPPPPPPPPPTAGHPDAESVNGGDYFPPTGAGPDPATPSSRNRHHHQIGNYYCNAANFKRHKSNPNNLDTDPNPNPNPRNSEYRSSPGGDYRKDREEWSDTAISCLLEAYTEKYNQLNRGNLRGRDWEEVAEAVSERGLSGVNRKSVEQCKNKIDNLKKRYKVEVGRVSSNGSSSWHWFKHIEAIMGSSGGKGGVGSSGEGDGGWVNGGGGGVGGGVGTSSGTVTVLRQAKRYAPGNPGLANNLKTKSVPSLKWRRVVFKISGAALAGNCQNIEPKVAMQIAREVATACRVGLEVAIVVGGRNFFCGDSWVSATGLERSTAYQIGMMATVMNSILLQSAFEKLGVEARVQSAFAMPELVEPYSRQRAIRHLEKGRVVIFGGVGAGAGNPLFSTDTAAALRASELNADAILKGTNVNGVYDCHSGNNNVILDHISFREVVSRCITSMDMMAITYCEENVIPVVVFNLLEPGNISRALCGEQVGTLIDQTGRIS